MPIIFRTTGGRDFAIGRLFIVVQSTTRHYLTSGMRDYVPGMRSWKSGAM